MINFPDNPQVDDEFTSGGRTWVWTGVSWDAKGTVQAPGPANELLVGTVAATEPGLDPVVTITGESPLQTINFELPRGIQGPPGNLSNLTAVEPIVYNSSTSTLSLSYSQTFLMMGA